MGDEYGELIFSSQNYDEVIKEVSNSIINHACEVIVTEDGQEKIDIVKDSLIECMVGIALTVSVIYPNMCEKKILQAILQEIAEKFYARFYVKKKHH